MLSGDRVPNDLSTLAKLERGRAQAHDRRRGYVAAAARRPVAGVSLHLARDTRRTWR